MAIELTSGAFTDGESIPRQHTCDGDDAAPPLEWSGVPDRTRSMALVVDDPDAPSGTFAHWLVYGLAADATSLVRGTPGRRELLAAMEGHVLAQGELTGTFGR